MTTVLKTQRYSTRQNPTPFISPSSSAWLIRLERLFLALVCLTLLTPFAISKQFFRASPPSAFFFRTMVDLTLPLYVGLLFASKRSKPSLKIPLSVALLTVFAVSVVSALLGENMLRSFWGNLERMGGIVQLAHLTVFYFYIVSLTYRGASYARFVLIALTVVAAAASVEGILVKLTNNHFLFNDPFFPRISGTFGNPSFLASLVISLFLSLLCLVKERRRWLQTAYAVVAVLDLCCVVLTRTRGAVLGVIAAIVVSATIYAFGIGNSRVRTYIGAALFTFIVAASFLFTHPERFESSSALGRIFRLNSASTVVRIEEWKAAFLGVKDRPLLGTGPENYYVVGNKYSASWFDKPHNSFLEILITTGLLGLAAVAGLLVVTIWTLAKSTKAGLLTLKESCLLLASFIAYNVQNAFVFDSIASSVAFYGLLGIIGAFSQPRLLQSTSKVEARARRLKLEWLAIGASCVVVAMAIYFMDITGIRFAAAVDSAYLYSGSDPQRSLRYFVSVIGLPFIFDPVDYSAKYSQFAVEMASTGQVSATQADRIIDQALRAQLDSISRVPNDALEYLCLSELYAAKAGPNNLALDRRAEDAITRALVLSPRNKTVLREQARIKVLLRDFAEAEAILRDLLRWSPGDLGAELQLASVYWDRGDRTAGVQLAEQVLKKGYIPLGALEIEWLATAYESQGNYQAAAGVYLEAVAIAPNSVRDFWLLANDYAKIGQPDKAIPIARAIAHLDPARTKEMDDFIASLK